MEGRYFALAVIAVCAAFGGGLALERFHLNVTPQTKSGPQIAYWVAPMDPKFRRDEPGKSPMTMDLPLLEGAEIGDVKEGQPVMMMLEKGSDGMFGIKALMPK